jgi:hypothetical protein
MANEQIWYPKFERIIDVKKFYGRNFVNSKFKFTPPTFFRQFVTLHRDFCHIFGTIHEVDELHVSI